MSHYSEENRSNERKFSKYKFHEKEKKEKHCYSCDDMCDPCDPCDPCRIRKIFDPCDCFGKNRATLIVAGDISQDSIASGSFTPITVGFSPCCLQPFQRAQIGGQIAAHENKFCETKKCRKVY